MTMKSSDGVVCTRCTVTVSEGVAVARYRWEGGDVDGRERFDEDVSDWTDDEIRDLAGDMVDIDEGRGEIEVVWD